MKPRDLRSAHRPWTTTAEELDVALASRDERTLSKALTFSFEGTKYCVKVRGPGTAMRGGKVMVHRLLDGRLQVTYKGAGVGADRLRQLPGPRIARGRGRRLVAIGALRGVSGSITELLFGYPHQRRRFSPKSAHGSMSAGGRDVHYEGGQPIKDELVRHVFSMAQTSRRQLRRYSATVKLTYCPRLGHPWRYIPSRPG